MVESTSNGDNRRISLRALPVMGHVADDYAPIATALIFGINQHLRSLDVSLAVPSINLEKLPVRRAWMSLVPIIDNAWMRLQRTSDKQATESYPLQVVRLRNSCVRPST